MIVIVNFSIAPSKLNIINEPKDKANMVLYMHGMIYYLSVGYSY